MMPSPEGRRPPCEPRRIRVTGFFTPCSVSDPVKEPLPSGASGFNPFRSISERIALSYPGALSTSRYSSRRCSLRRPMPVSSVRRSTARLPSNAGERLALGRHRSAERRRLRIEAAADRHRARHAYVALLRAPRPAATIGAPARSTTTSVVFIERSSSVVETLVANDRTGELAGRSLCTETVGKEGADGRWPADDTVCQAATTATCVRTLTTAHTCTATCQQSAGEYSSMPRVGLAWPSTMLVSPLSSPLDNARATLRLSKRRGTGWPEC